MPGFLVDPITWVALWPAILFPLIVASLLAWIIVHSEPKQSYVTALVVIYAFSLLGVVAGFIAGNSRESITDAVVPAVLTLVGVVLVYIVSGEQRSAQRLVAAGVIAISIWLLLGTSWGAFLRRQAEQYAADPDISLARGLQMEEVRFRLETAKILNDAKLKKLREDIGLGSDGKVE